MDSNERRLASVPIWIAAVMGAFLVIVAIVLLIWLL